MLTSREEVRDPALKLETDKMSIALSEAVDDLETLAALPGWRPKMSSWVVYRDDPDPGEPVCEFCLAGAALLRRTDESFVFPATDFISHLPVATRRMLNALDELRKYEFAAAFNYRYYLDGVEAGNIPVHRIRRSLRAVSALSRMFRPANLVTYHQEPARFLRNMRSIADRLDDYGF